LDENTVLAKAAEFFRWLEAENVEKPLNAIRKDLKLKVNHAYLTAFVLELRYKLMLLIDKIIFKFKLNKVFSKS
jgi:hypothetical protein